MSSEEDILKYERLQDMINHQLENIEKVENQKYAADAASHDEKLNFCYLKNFCRRIKEIFSASHRKEKR